MSKEIISTILLLSYICLMIINMLIKCFQKNEDNILISNILSILALITILVFILSATYLHIGGLNE